MKFGSKAANFRLGELRNAAAGGHALREVVREANTPDCRPQMARRGRSMQLEPAPLVAFETETQHSQAAVEKQEAEARHSQARTGELSHFSALVPGKVIVLDACRRPLGSVQNEDRKIAFLLYTGLCNQNTHICVACVDLQIRMRVGNIFVGNAFF